MVAAQLEDVPATPPSVAVVTKHSVLIRSVNIHPGLWDACLADVLSTDSSIIALD